MSVYVERCIDTPIDRIWELTQKPEAHQRWDLRFTRIAYLPRKSPEDAQEFTYETRLGFGLRICGMGTTRGERSLPDGSSVSALVFGSESPFSLIRKGSGYWKYVPTARGVRFITVYDYAVRWGRLGWWMDKLVFRPLMAWATAWSFDRLARWAVQGTSPEASRRAAVAYSVSRGALAGVWLYEAIFPKLLGPHPQELTLSIGAGIPRLWVPGVVWWLGWIEVAMGVLLLLFWRRRWPALASALAMIPATLAGAFGDPSLLSAPFNVLVINGMVAALSIIVMVLLPEVVSAKNCQWSAYAAKSVR